MTANNNIVRSDFHSRADCNLDRRRGRCSARCHSDSHCTTTSTTCRHRCNSVTRGGTGQRTGTTDATEGLCSGTCTGQVNYQSVLSATNIFQVHSLSAKGMTSRQWLTGDRIRRIDGNNIPIWLLEQLEGVGGQRFRIIRKSVLQPPQRNIR